MSEKTGTNLTDAESAEVTTERPALVPQPHGGALLAGGVKGNKGGGRPKDAIRLDLQTGFDEAAKLVIRKIREGEYQDGQLLKALEVLGRFSMGDAKDVSLTVGGVLQIAADAIADEVDSIVTETYPERNESQQAQTASTWAQRIYNRLSERCKDL